MPEVQSLKSRVYDYVIIGSGFGGSVCAIRLTDKGYSVLVLEKGKRFNDSDFAKTNWQFWKYLWLPAIRAFGILQISILKGVMVLHGAGVGGGSLGYANVLEIPTNETFTTAAWNQNVAWGEVLKPHYETVKRMLGAARNPKLWTADNLLQIMAEERRMGHTFRATDVGAFLVNPVSRCQIRILEVLARTGPAVNTAVGVWLAAAIIPKILFRRTIFIL